MRTQSRCVLSVLLALSLLPPTGVQTAGADQAQLQEFSSALAEVVAQVKPGVVAIVAEGKVTVTYRDPFSGTPFERFFGFPPSEPPTREFERSGQGSGVIVGYGGKQYILTNNHVIRQADAIRVQLADDRYFSAEVVGADSLSDVAVLRVKASALPTVPFGSSDALREGELVLAVGNPLGYAHSVTLGIVSAVGRSRFSVSEYGSYIQTDAAINPGNSGGALVNMRGELVGLNTAIVSRSGMNEGIGFAIPSDMVRDVMGQLIENGEVRRGLLGALIGDIDPTAAEGLGLPNTRGVEIRSVQPGGPAAVAGLKAGDIVLAVDGKQVRNATELKGAIGATSPDTRVQLRILRDGREQTVAVKLGKLTAEAMVAAGGQQSEAAASALGLEVQELTPEIARSLRADHTDGVVVAAVAPGSEASRRGIERGDIIREVNHREVTSVQEYEDALEQVEPGQVVLMLVERRGTTRYVGLRVPAK